MQIAKPAKSRQGSNSQLRRPLALPFQSKSMAKADLANRCPPLGHLFRSFTAHPIILLDPVPINRIEAGQVAPCLRSCDAHELGFPTGMPRGSPRPPNCYLRTSMERTLAGVRKMDTHSCVRNLDAPARPL